MERKQADRIAAALEELVLTGQFQTGQRLDEAGLAKRFGVSRTPVREALRHLVAVDLAQQLPRRGVFVRQPDSIMLIEMFETMAEIEGVCSRLAAQRITPETLELLHDVNARCRVALESNNAALYSQHNEEFHHMIYRMSGNAFLEKQAVKLYRLLKPFRRMQFQMRGRMAASCAEHDALIAAFSQNQAAVASDLARAHVASQGERFFHQMAQLRRDPDLRCAG